MSQDDPRYAGIARLYGSAALARFRAARVVVVGIGGVGGWVVEALARSGIGALTLIDGDDVCISNTNRQISATGHTLGQPKVQVLAARVAQIDPSIRVEPRAHFLTTKNLRDEVAGADAVVDACDALRVKIELAACCRRNKQPIVVVGAAGGRRDPTLVRIRDLSKTEHDKLLSTMRGALRDDFGFTRNPKRYFGIPAVYSLEHPMYPDSDGGVCQAKPDGGGRGLDCSGGLGAATHLTGAFAYAAASVVLAKLAGLQ